MDQDERDADEGREEAAEATIPCPYCRSPIYEDAPRCPRCGNYISDEDAPAARKPWWIIGGALLVLYIVYRWMF